MADILTGHIVGRFPGGDSAYPLAIENDPGIYSDGDIHLLLFPGDAPSALQADVGSIRQSGTKPVDVPGGVLQFSGSASAQMPRRPDYSSPEFKVLFAFDLEGNPTTVGIKGFNPAQNKVLLTKECHAAVAYTGYTTRALQLLYTPVIEQYQLGTRTHYGVIAVFNAPSTMLIYQVEPPQIVENGNDDIELYRIVSYAITTPEGEFEKPPGYPQSGQFPGGPEIDVTNAVQSERVHEIGTMDSRGRGWVRTYYVRKASPYQGDSSYTIPTTCIVSTLGDKYDKDLQLKAKNFIASRNLGCK